LCSPRHGAVVDAVAGVRGEPTVGIADICRHRIAPRDETAARVEARGTEVVAHVGDESELVGLDALVSKRHPQSRGLAAEPVGLVVERHGQHPLREVDRRGMSDRC
jgi:hypothetical protein